MLPDQQDPLADQKPKPVEPTTSASSVVPEGAPASVKNPVALASAAVPEGAPASVMAPVENFAAPAAPVLSPSNQMSGGRNPWVVGPLARAEKLYPHDVNRRASYFSPSSFTYMPWTIARYIVSSVPDDQLRAMGKHMNAVLPWLEERDGFAGVPGTLTAARSFALATNNQDALTLLARVQNLDSASQQMVMVSLQKMAQTGGVTSTNQDTIQAALDLLTPDTQMASVQTAVTKGGTSVAAYTLPNVDDSVTIANALYGLTGARVQIGGLGVIDSAIQGSIPHDIARAFGRTTVDVLHAADVAIGTVLKPIGLALEAGKKGYQGGEKFLQGGNTPERLASMVPATLAATIGGIEHLFNGIQGGIHWTVDNSIGRGLQLFGMDKNSPDYQNTVRALTDFGTIYVTGKASEFMKAYTAGGVYLPEAGAAELGINTPLSETPTGWFGNRILDDPKYHPLKVIDYYIKDFAYNLGGGRTPIGDVMAGKVGADVFDRVVETRNAGTKLGLEGDALDRYVTGTLVAQYGTAPFIPDLMSVLTRMDRAAMPEAATSHLENAARMGPDEVRALVEERSALQGQVPALVGTRSDAAALEGYTVTDAGATFPAASITGPGGAEAAVEQIPGTNDFHMTHSSNGGTPGQGEPLYNAVASWAESQGGTLVSSQTSLSDSARALWEKLVSQGKAERIETPAAPITSDMTPLEQAAAEASSAAPPTYRWVNTQAGEFAAQDLASARARIAAINEQLRWASEANPPAIKYPKASVLRSAVRNPATATERLVNLFVKKLSDWTHIDVRDFSDNIAGGGEPLFNPFRPDAPKDWASRNAESLGKELHRYGVPDAEVSQLVGRMMEMRNDQDFFKLVAERRDLLKRFLPPDTPVELRRSILEIHDKPIDQRTTSRFSTTHTSPDGTTTPGGDYVLMQEENGVNVPVPADAIEFSNHVMLSDPRGFQEAMTWRSRKLDAVKTRAEAGSWLDKVVRYPADALISTPKFIMKLATTAWKGPTLLFHLPAMIERTFIEHAMRAKLSGYKAVVWFPDGMTMDLAKIEPFLRNYFGKDTMDATMGANPTIAALMDRFSNAGPAGDGRIQLISPDSRMSQWDPHAQDLGVLYQDLIEPTTGSKPYIPVPTFDIQGGTRAPSYSDFQAVADKLQRLNTGPVTRGLAASGLDVEAFLARVDQSAELTRLLHDQMHELIANDPRAAGMTYDEALRGYLERQVQHINSVTRGDPELQDLVATGKWEQHAGNADAATADSYGQHLVELAAQDARLKELGDLVHTNAATVDERASYRALQDARKQALSAMQDEESRLGPEATKNIEDQVSKIGRKPGKNASLTRSLRSKWEAGTWEFPNEIYKKQGGRWEGDNVGQTMENMSAGFTNAVYRPFKVASKIDLMGARGSTFRQAADRAYEGFLNNGMAEADARAFAELDAARTVRNLMYRMGSRTTFQQATRDVFWFEPVSQSILKSWLVKIPSQYGLAGYPLLALKAAAYLKLFEDLGVVKRDSQGKLIIPDPLASLFSSVLGGHPEIAYRYATSIQPHWSTPWPTVSTLPALAIHKIIQNNHGLLGDVANMLAPSDIPTASVPANLNYGIEAMTGHPVPWEFLSPAYQKLAWDRSFDQAVQVAFQQDYLDKGILPPRPEQFMTGPVDPATGDKTINAGAYRTAVLNFTRGLFNDAEHIARSNALVHFVASTFTPGNVSITTKERATFYDFLNKNVFSSTDGSVTDAQLALMHTYVADHPESLAYSYFTSYATGKHQELLNDPNGDFTAEYLQGARHQMTPQEYMRTVQTATSQAHYHAQLDRLIRTVSPNLDLSTILTEGGKVSPLRLQVSDEWRNYQRLTPGVAADLMNKQLRYAALGYGTAPVFEATRVTDLLHNFEMVAPLFTGEGGITSSEYKTVRGTLAAQVAQIYAAEDQKNSNVSPLERGIADFYTKVMDPYMTETKPIWDAIQAANISGEDTSSFYSQLAAIRQKYDNMDRSYTYHGKSITLPTPEQVFYGNKSTQDQLYTRLHWSSEPLYWLSPFQLNTAGFKDFTGRDELALKMDTLATSFAAQEKAAGVAPGSSQSDAWKLWEAQQYQALGAQYGADGANFVGLSIGTVQNGTVIPATPLSRLQSLGVGADSQAFQSVAADVQRVAQDLLSQGLSPKGTTGRAEQDKVWLYDIIKQYRDPSSPYYEKSFDETMRNLSYASPMAGYDQREGVLLYEAIFFNNWTPALINPDLVQAVA